MTVQNKRLSSQCNTNAQIEPVQDNIPYQPHSKTKEKNERLANNNPMPQKREKRKEAIYLMSYARYVNKNSQIVQF